MYGGDAFGWHDRVRTAIKTYAATQMQDPETAPPKPDPETRLTRQAMDSTMHTKGRIWSQPNSDSSLYNMQEVFIDEALYHYRWTGDEEYAQEIFPVIKNHLAWEKRCFDPDNDGLYENYANTHISDAHWYSGSPCTQASAYTYRANLMAAQMVRRLGEDDTPFCTEAEKIKQAVDRVLWLKEQGYYAEYKDLLGNQLLHTSVELPTIYHPIDFYMTDMFQSYQLMRYTEYALERVPLAGGGELIWSSNWLPWIWSVRMIGSNEAMNTAIAYYKGDANIFSLRYLWLCSLRSPTPSAYVLVINP
ncbi:hypothetical protein FJZ31_23125 [Candidatus Poribacteria bacterium]|nr:hypothetical protein [Candidatus Poribacteria bacterium]